MVNCRRKVWIILLLLLLIIGRGRILAKEEMTAELMTIEELKQQEEYTVARLRGWITAKASDVFMEDSTGGIELLFTNFKNRRYLVGSQVEVQGKLRWKPKNNVGYLSIDGEENFKTLGKRISVSPMKIDPSEIEKELGRFVSIQNIKILEEGTEIRKLAQSGDVKFYIYDMRKNGKLPLEVGDHIDEIQGIASDRGNFPHLCIRVLKDIGKITKPQSPIEPDEPEEKPIDPDPEKPLPNEPEEKPIDPDPEKPLPDEPEEKPIDPDPEKPLPDEPEEKPIDPDSTKPLPDEPEESPEEEDSKPSENPSLPEVTPTPEQPNWEPIDNSSSRKILLFSKSNNEEERKITDKNLKEITFQWKEGEAYITGYPDGTFRPNRKLTRGEGASLLYRVIEASEEGYFNFQDVEENSWYREAVERLAYLGILSGDENQNFYPNREMSRRVFFESVGKIQRSKKNIFDNNETSSGEDNIMELIREGIVVGDGKGNYRLDEGITRGEAVVILNQVLPCCEKTGEIKNKKIPWDIINHWAYEEIMKALK